MFYSQFILAKKGPLGTIWIAAHLERKLRKNQVADTDIGVSVDSILFPEVPIALRLSSHLLLGVVRIYSRKVNYLFDDCSEALLKIKQAFRSTAVDLPPEESKAPYHSITLPETFDLDDFELPDSDILQGNYVDHHISSREQITLQDNMENVVYSTSQFGLDERFGDGDTSGLDLDEELFLDKVNAAARAAMSVDPQSSVPPMMPLKQDQQDNGMATNSETRIEVTSEHVDLMEYAQAPCTPGLVEEPNLSNVQETSACDDHMESEDNILTECPVKENLESISCKSNLNQGNEHTVDWSLSNNRNSDTVGPLTCEENGYHSSDLKIKQGQTTHTEVSIEHALVDDGTGGSGTSLVATKDVTVTCQEPESTKNIVAASDNLNKREEQNGIPNVDGVEGPSHEFNKDHGECNGIISKGTAQDNSCLSSPSQHVGNSTHIQEESIDVEVTGNLEKSYSSGVGLGLDGELQDVSCHDKPKDTMPQESLDSDIPKLAVHDEMLSAQAHHLRPCNTTLSQPDSLGAGGELSNDIPSADDAVAPRASECEELFDASGCKAVVQGEKCHEVDQSGTDLKDNQDAEVNMVGADSILKYDNHPSGLDVPAPEKQLSVPEGFGKPRDMQMETTPGDLTGIDESDAGSRIISGKKRSYTESTLTEQSLNSVESSRIVRNRRTIEAVPDDDDLLSSILVGRRSSVLKVKPTPPPTEITSLKRHRSAPRSSASKRKVLMDDTMVLHGDTIRQQLMNTDDIRRIRRKAPCTPPEIAMILKQFLEEEIFGEPICSGMSMELASLHNQTYDLSRITISQDDVHDTFPLAESDMKITSGADGHVHEFCVDNIAGSSTVAVSDMGGVSEHEVVREIAQPGETPVPSEDKMDEHRDTVVEDGVTHVTIAADTTSSQPEHPHYPTENAVGESCSIPEAVDPALVADIELGDVGQPSDGAFQVPGLDKANAMDAPVIPSDEKREECIEVDASLVDGSNGRIDVEEGLVKEDDALAAVEIMPDAKNDTSLDVNQHGAAVETERNCNEQEEYNVCGPSIEIETDLGRVQYHDQLFHEDTSAEPPIVGASYHPECMNVQGTSLDDWEYALQHEPYPANAIDAEISGIDIHDDLNYAGVADDTEFLNVDDDEVAEVTDDYTPNTEEIRITENSGWSSRTRAVGKYLQTLFVKEAECGRKAIPVDNLLVGKTRKEASRMFFEALVLKTRDYIHVEQEHPYDNIVIRPRMKLMKSDF